MPSAVLSRVLVALSLPVSLVSAYSWKFDANPQQCSNLTITVSGTDGTPPYRVLLLPFGASPLANNIEARRIVDQPFDGTSTNVSFQLKYPANSQFVAVVSDSKTFGSGGTSVAAQVSSSSDSSCFDASTNVKPDFVFSIEPANQIVQCTATRIWWDATTVQGTPNFLGVIPGGESFAVPQGDITNITSQGTGFSWTPNLRGGTTLILVGGDNRGNGTAGSSLNLVSSGINNDGSCLSDSSPSSTPGSPAGGSYPTSTDGSGVGGGGSSGGSKTNVGAIVGGVIGGLVVLAALLLLLLFFKRRSRLHKRQKERPLDLLNADEGDETTGGALGSGRNELPQYYEPEPFLVPDPTLGRSSDAGQDSEERPLSGLTSSRSGTPDLLGMSSGTSNTTRKGGNRPLRPVNIIQHDDAGPSEAPKQEAGEPETIELPPAYTNIKKPAEPAAATDAQSHVPPVDA